MPELHLAILSSGDKGGIKQKERGAGSIEKGP
jgi:hypothetical protein